MQLNHREILVLLLLGALGLGGCGPELTTIQKEEQQLKENIARKQAMFAPLTGNYEGLLTFDDGTEPAPVRLVLVPMTILMSNPGRNDVSEVPTLGGSLNRFVVSDSRGRSTLPFQRYNNAQFDPDTSRLFLYGNTSGAGTENVHFSLDALVTGDRITGRIYSSLKVDIGTIDVKRVR